MTSQRATSTSPGQARTLGSSCYFILSKNEIKNGPCESVLVSVALRRQQLDGISDLFCFEHQNGSASVPTHLLLKKSKLHTTVVDRLCHIPEPQSQSAPPPLPIRPCTPLTIYSYLLFSVVLKQVRRNKTRYKSGTGLRIPNNNNKLKKDVTSVGSFCFFLCVSEKPQQHKQLERSSTYMTVLQLRTKPYLPSNKPVF